MIFQNEEPEQDKNFMEIFQNQLHDPFKTGIISVRLLEIEKETTAESLYHQPLL